MGRPHLIGRIIVFTLNFAFWASGILLVVFGSMALADPSSIIKMLNLIDGVENVTNLIDVLGLLEGVAIFMIVLGCFLFLLGGNGCHGVAKKHRKSILAYNVLLLCSILIEIALIIYAAVYPGTTEDQVKTDLQASLNESFARVNVTDEYTLVYSETDTDAYYWQNLEFDAGCCAAYGYTDYEALTWNRNYTINATDYYSAVPLSCCKTIKEGQTPNTLYQLVDYKGCLSGQPSAYNQNGCWQTVDDMLWNFNLIAIIISSCLIAAEILGVIFAIHLWTRLKD